LPELALLAVLGDNVNRLRVPFISRKANGGVWAAITNHVLARPAVLAIATTALLLALTAPIVTLDLGFNSGSDAYNDAVEGLEEGPARRLIEELSI